MATNGSFAQQEQFSASTGPATDSNKSSGDVGKDEVGWYFVESYYTMLSKNPERLHLFYNKSSQLVCGEEGTTESIALGRAAIQDRISQLDYQDCKVRVSNVDSQASKDSIVIQVIGETSNKAGELKKFVQTFILAQQPSGYFVLNDIFRYLKEEGDEELAETVPEESATAAPVVADIEVPTEAAHAEASAEEPALDTEAVDEKLEETISSEEASPATNGTKIEPKDEIQAEVKTEEVPTPEVVEKTAEQEVTKEEAPKEPVSTPVVASPAPVVAKPTGPPKPLTWASRAAAAAGAPKPALPAVPSAAKTAAPQATRTAAAAQQPKPVPVQVAPAAPNSDSKENASPTAAGWQTAGEHAKKQIRPQSVSGPPEKEGTMGYVRNVTEKVSDADLRAALAKFGELIYFDINRQKNCAFVEYSQPAGYQAASAANPHQIGEETIFVEARRPKASAYGGNGYAPRGGMNNRGRGGFPQGGRPGENRGNFGPTRGRGGGAPRARGGAATTTA